MLWQENEEVQAVLRGEASETVYYFVEIDRDENLEIIGIRLSNVGRDSDPSTFAENESRETFLGWLAESPTGDNLLTP